MKKPMTIAELLELMDEVLLKEKDEGPDMFLDVVTDTTYYL